MDSFCCSSLTCDVIFKVNSISRDALSKTWLFLEHSISTWFAKISDINIMFALYFIEFENLISLQLWYWWLSTSETNCLLISVCLYWRMTSVTCRYLPCSYLNASCVCVLKKTRNIMSSGQIGGKKFYCWLLKQRSFYTAFSIFQYWLCRQNYLKREELR